MAHRPPSTDRRPRPPTTDLRRPPPRRLATTVPVSSFTHTFPYRSQTPLPLKPANPKGREVHDGRASKPCNRHGRDQLRPRWEEVHELHSLLPAHDGPQGSTDWDCDPHHARCAPRPPSPATSPATSATRATPDTPAHLAPLIHIPTHPLTIIQNPPHPTQTPPHPPFTQLDPTAS